MSLSDGRTTPLTETATLRQQWNRKLKKKGGTKILLEIIEYSINSDGKQQTYRLIARLIDITQFSAFLLATEYHQRS